MNGINIEVYKNEGRMVAVQGKIWSMLPNRPFQGIKAENLF
jgi:hypothetical protein